MNKTGTDQIGWICRLVCTFVVHKHQRQVFSHRGPYIRKYVFVILCYYAHSRRYAFVRFLMIYSFLHQSASFGQDLNLGLYDYFHNVYHRGVYKQSQYLHENQRMWDQFDTMH